MAQYLSLLIVRLFVKGRFRKRNLRKKPSQLELGNTSERKAEDQNTPHAHAWGFFSAKNNLVIILSLKQKIKTLK